MAGLVPAIPIMKCSALLIEIAGTSLAMTPVSTQSAPEKNCRRT